MSERMFSRDARIVREPSSLDLIYFLASEFTRATTVDRILVYLFIYSEDVGED